MRKSAALRSLIAAACVAPSLAFADPVILGFEGVVGDAGANVGAAPYVESGFTFTTTPATGNNVGVFGKNASNSNGSATFVFCSFDSGCTPGTTVTLTGTAPFSLDSIDLGNYQIGGGAGTMELIGHLVGGGTVTTTLGLSSTWATSLLSGFDNLQSVEFKGHTVFGVAFDNLVINADGNTVPEPASLALVGVALAGLAAAARRKRA